jgi:hypothetical protein
MRKRKDAVGMSWLVGQMWYVVEHQSNDVVVDDLSIAGRRSNRGNGNQGYTDALTFSQDSLFFLLDSVPREFGLDRSWCTPIFRQCLPTGDP